MIIIIIVVVVIIIITKIIIIVVVAIIISLICRIWPMVILLDMKRRYSNCVHVT